MTPYAASQFYSWQRHPQSDGWGTGGWMMNRRTDGEQKDGWGTDGRMANKRTDGEQTDVKQRVGRQIDGWGLANRQMDGEQKDGW